MAVCYCKLPGNTSKRYIAAVGSENGIVYLKCRQDFNGRGGIQPMDGSAGMRVNNAQVSKMVIQTCE